MANLVKISNAPKHDSISENKCGFSFISPSILDLSAYGFNSAHETFKETVHPKIKSLSLFTRPHVVANLTFYLLQNTKEVIFKEYWQPSSFGDH